MAGAGDPSIARNLGAFFGHIVKAIKTDPTAPPSVEVSRSVQEDRQPDGVILRRTTVDEVVLPPDHARANAPDRPSTPDP